MKTLAMLAAAAIAFATPALAQQTVTSERVLPNGDVRTSTTVHTGGMGMNGQMDHRMDRRMDHRMNGGYDGRDRTVVSERVVHTGGRGWHRGHEMRRVCKTRVQHGRSMRKCWMVRR